MKHDNNISTFRFKGYAAENIYFRLNSEFDGNEEEIKLDLDFNRDIDIIFEAGKAIVVLECIVFNDCEDNNYPFTLDITMLGFFEFDGDLSEGKVKSMLEVNGTAILFPYLRTLITTITSSSGLQPVIIPTMNISKMINNEKK